MRRLLSILATGVERGALNPTLKPRLFLYVVTLPRHLVHRVAVQAFHSVLNLVHRLLFPIEPLDPHQIQRVNQQRRLNAHVKWRVSRHRGRNVNLQEPRFQIGVNQNVEAEQLVAIRAMAPILLHSDLDVVLRAQQSPNDKVKDARPQQVHINAHLLQVLAEGSQGPLESEVVLLAVFIGHEFLIFLVDRVVG